MDASLAQFTDLALQHPLDKEYWRELAISHQKQGNYRNAVIAWAFVALLAAEDPLPHLHAAECLLAQGEKDEAHKALKMALELSGHDQGLRNKILTLLTGESYAS
jgi:Flp pilus assembly protein TadD